MQATAETRMPTQAAESSEPNPFVSEMLVRVAVLLLLTVCLGQQPCTRWHNCPPCGNGTSEVDLLAFLSTEAATQPASLAYFLNVRKALEIIKSFGAVHSDDLFFLHTTVSYLCCYLPLQYTDAIFPALDAVAWPPLNVSFGAAVCNLDSATNDPPANTTSIILLLDEQSQQQLGERKRRKLFSILFDQSLARSRDRLSGAGHSGRGAASGATLHDGALPLHAGRGAARLSRPGRVGRRQPAHHRLERRGTDCRRLI